MVSPKMMIRWPSLILVWYGMTRWEQLHCSCSVIKKGKDPGKGLTSFVTTFGLIATHS